MNRGLHRGFGPIDAYATGLLVAFGSFAGPTFNAALTGSAYIAGGTPPYSIVSTVNVPAGITFALSGNAIVASGVTSAGGTYFTTIGIRSNDGQRFSLRLAIVCAAPVYATFDPSNKTAHASLSVGNSVVTTTSTGGTPWATALSTLSKSSGKTYVEFNRYAKAVNGNCGAGVALSLPTDGDYPGQSSSGWGHLSDGYKTHSGFSAYGTNWDTIGDVLMVAHDIPNGTIWFGKNGTWFGSGDPATGANPTFTGLPASTFYLIGGSAGTADSVQVNTGGSAFGYTPPTGFVDRYSA